MSTPFTVSIFSFFDKIQDAVGMVPSMTSKDKLEAVKLWNMTSEKLQEIVNSYAADLSAVAAQLPQRDPDKDTRPKDPPPLYAELSPPSAKTDTENSLESDIREIRPEGHALTHLLTCEAYVPPPQIPQPSANSALLPLELETTYANSLTSFSDIPCEGTPETQVDNIRNDSNVVDSAVQDTLLASQEPEAATFPNLPDKENEVNYSEISPAADDVPNSKESSNKRYKCPECKARFRTRAYLVCHLRTHTGEKPFPCPKCPARFTTAGNLNRHVRSHDGIKPYHCDICNRRFSEKKSLVAHQRQHTGEKPYRCPHCDMRFSYSNVLAAHVACHLNLKEYLCEECGKAFRQKSQLRMHLLRHKGVTRYHCQCSASFLVKGDFVRHMKTHLTEKSSTCDVCGQVFSDRNTLEAHRETHFGPRPFKCRECAMSFSDLLECKKHLKTHVEKLSP